MLIKDIEEELTRKDISKYMKDLGWTKLGSGNYGVVYGKKDHNMVVKILVSKYNNDSIQSAAESLQDKFLKFIIKNPNIHYPKFYQTKAGNIAGQPFKMYEMERLKKLSPIEDYVIGYMGQLADYGYSLEQIYNHILRQLQPDDDISVMKYIKDYNYFKTKFQSLYKAMEKLIAGANKLGVVTDIAGDYYTNVMKRDDGTFVIMDPWAA